MKIHSAVVCLVALGAWLASATFSIHAESSSNTLSAASAKSSDPTITGEEVAEEKAKKMSFAFKGDRLEVSGDKEVEKYTFKLNSSKNPKQIEFGEAKDSFVPGIYELDGDTLKVCGKGKADMKPEERPKEFKTPPKSQVVISYWKRK